jgi:hypothetical protein
MQCCVPRETASTKTRRRRAVLARGKHAALVGALLVSACQAQPSANTQTRSLLDLATAREVIGLSAAELQARLGAPTYKQDYGSNIEGWGYAFEGCQIEHQLRSEVVGAFQVRLEPGCRPPLRGVEGLEGAGVAWGVTFATLTKGLAGDWRSVCLANCVDPSPPTISYYASSGAAPPTRLEVLLDAQMSAPDAAAAGATWRRALEVEAGAPAGGPIPARSYACGEGAQDSAAEAMGPVRVQAVSVGHVLDPGLNQCGRAPKT